MIDIQDLHKAFNNHTILQGVNVTINTGTSHIIIGKSGSGKSVLLKHMIGLLSPDKGRVLVDGMCINDLQQPALYALRRRFGMLFQGAALFDSFSVADNIALGVRENQLFPESEIPDRVEEKLKMIGLPGIGNNNGSAHQ